jgi:outer membrane protein TolC
VAEENLRIAKARLKEGASTPLAVDRADVELARADLLMIEAQRTWAASRRTLASSAGLPEPEALSTKAPDTEAAPTEDLLLTEAEKKRPELHAARKRLDQAGAGQFSAWAQFAPSISATATQRFGNAPGFNGQATYWQAGLTADWQLLDFGGRSAGLKRERAAAMRAQAELERLRTAVRDEVHSTWLDVESARAKVVSARRGDVVSKRAADETRARYKAGTATQLDVVQADRDALQAEADRIRAEGELQVARLALKRAAGEPWWQGAPAESQQR